MREGPADRLELPAPWASAPKAFLSLRAAGDMGVRDPANDQRRDGWLRAAGFDPAKAQIPDMSHSRAVASVAGVAPGAATRRPADGLVTAGLEPGACLLVTVADCMPLFLYDRGTGAFGVLHSGWKGTGILAAAISEMRSRFGSRPGDIALTLGPSIRSCCYSVDEPRAESFQAEFGSSAVKRAGSRTSLDLAAANRSIAEAAGLRSVLDLGLCTACDDRFGSYRREGPVAFTRMAAVIGWPETPGR